MKISSSKASYSSESFEPPARFWGDVIEKYLKTNDYSLLRKCAVGSKPGGGIFIVDYKVWKDINPNSIALIMYKTQSGSGSTEAKLPYDVIKLVHAIKTNPKIRIAYLLLDGDGFSESIRSFMRYEKDKYITGANWVKVYFSFSEFQEKGIAIPI